MNQLNMDEVKKCADEGLAGFYQQRMKLLHNLSLPRVTGKGLLPVQTYAPSISR